MNREFFVVIEKAEDGLFVGEVPQLKACYSQGKTIDELMNNMKEAIALALDCEKTWAGVCFEKSCVTRK